MSTVHISGRTNHRHFILSGKAMRKIFSRMRVFAEYADTVLIVGETGVGKDMIARELHRISGRSNRPFKRVPLSALSETLLESELFGHEKGSFTGADRKKIGIFEEANGGMLYFPEISEIPEYIQLKLLEFLEYRVIRRIGQNPQEKEIMVDVCLIFATNDDPSECVRKKKLRNDFFYRINKCRLDIPPLRERLDEIGPLTEHFTRLHGKRMFGRDVGVAMDAIEGLKHYHWPGNVRELEDVIEQALVRNADLIMNGNDGVLLYPEHMQRFFTDGKREQKTVFNHCFSGITNLPAYDSAMLESERAYLCELMNRARGNQRQAALIAGFSLKTLQRKLKKFGIGNNRHNI